jgi:hypothetical protein
VASLRAEELPVRGFVAQRKTFCYQAENGDEAYYLAAALNAAYVNERIKRHQPRGLGGPRGIERLAFEVLPVPRFDPQDPRHMELVELSRACHDKVAALVPQLKGQSIGRLRSQVRTHLSAELARIDGLVEQILP